MPNRIPSFNKGIYRAIPFFESDQNEMSTSERWRKAKLTSRIVQGFDSLNLTSEEYERIYSQLIRKKYFIEAEWLRKYMCVRVKRERSVRIV